jgi:hypothetical protein
MAFSFLIVMWGVAFNKVWRREEQMCAFKWGTKGVEQDAPARPQFAMQKGVTERLSPVTDQVGDAFGLRAQAHRHATGDALFAQAYT